MNSDVLVIQQQAAMRDRCEMFTAVCGVQVFQQEVASRRELVVSLQDNTALDASIRSQLLQLSNIWERVQELGDVRENKLTEALELVTYRIFLLFSCCDAVSVPCSLCESRRLYELRVNMYHIVLLIL